MLVGSPGYATHKLRKRAQSIIADAVRIAEVLRDGPACMSQRFDYLPQHVAPSLTEPVARELDVAMWGILEAACGLKILRS